MLSGGAKEHLANDHEILFSLNRQLYIVLEKINFSGVANKN